MPSREISSAHPGPARARWATAPTASPFTARAGTWSAAPQPPRGMSSPATAGAASCCTARAPRGIWSRAITSHRHQRNGGHRQWGRRRHRPERGGKYDWRRQRRGGNLLSGNSQGGVGVKGTGADGNLVQGNYIGRTPRAGWRWAMAYPGSPFSAATAIHRRRHVGGAQRYFGQ